MVRYFQTLLELIRCSGQTGGVWVVIFAIVVAIFDTLSVFSIFPFLSLATDPSLIQSNLALRELYRIGNFASVSSLIVAIGIGCAAIVLLASVLRWAYSLIQSRYSWRIYSRLSRVLLSLFLKQPFHYYAQTHSAEMQRYLQSEISIFIVYGMQPALAIVARLSSAVILSLMLLIIDPTITITASVVLAISYFLLFHGVREMLARQSEKVRVAHQNRFSLAAEILTGAKLIRIQDAEGYFSKLFEYETNRFSDGSAKVEFLSQAPKNILEGIFFAGVPLVLIAALNGGGSVSDILPTMGLFAFAAYRIMPTANTLLASASAIKFGLPRIIRLRDEIRAAQQRIDADLSTVSHSLDSTTTTETETDSLLVRLENVSVRYPGVAESTLKNINLTIMAGDRIAIIGPSGAGKSTLVGAVLGLLRPAAGSLYFGHLVRGSSKFEPKDWLKQVGYVPQEIFLLDASIRENVAFGIDPDRISQQAVVDACVQASIHDFIQGSLPETYDTKVGERGARLSGGQRQRLGIARALYRQPKILVLDEATSALDLETEREIMSTIFSLGKELTIIVISHRLSEIKKFNKVVRLENGETIAPFDESLPEFNLSGSGK